MEKISVRQILNFQLVKSENIVLAHEVFVREGCVNYQETNGKCNSGWNTV